MIDYDKHVLKRILARRLIIDRGYITPCWEWKGDTYDNGYGRISYCDKITRVHRLFFRLNNLDTFKEYLYVLHKCDNRKCFNLEHLFQGTQSDNIRDAVAKGRFKIRRAGNP